VPARRPRLVFTVFDSPALADRFTDVIVPAVAAEPSGVDLVADPGRRLYLIDAIRNALDGGSGEGGPTEQDSAGAGEQAYVVC